MKRVFPLITLGLLLARASAGNPAPESGVLLAPDHVRTCAAPFDASQPLRQTVRPGDSLRFLFGSDPLVDSARVRFTVAVEDAGATRLVFDRTLDPSKKAKDTGWQDGRVDLSSFAGRDVTFHFRSEPVRAGGRSGGRWAAVRIGAFARRAGEFNVILISLDTLRSDHLGLHGYPRNTSPNIDKLGRAGVDFLRGEAASSWTKPSHGSVFTSLMPRSHGLRLNDNQAGMKTLSPSVVTLAQVLQSAGYVTRAFTGGMFVCHWYGFDRGFDEYQEVWGPEHWHTKTGMPKEIFPPRRPGSRRTGTIASLFFCTPTTFTNRTGTRRSSGGA